MTSKNYIIIYSKRGKKLCKGFFINSIELAKWLDYFSKTDKQFIKFGEYYVNRDDISRIEYKAF